MKYFCVMVIVFYGLSVNLFAQPDIDIQPGRVEFEDVFNRLDYALLINRGDQELVIDSLSVTKNFYLLDFEGGLTPPVSISPGDTLRVNIILTNFYNITTDDTSDIITVYSNDPNGPTPINISINFFDDDFGDCTGRVFTEEVIPLADCKLYFFYYGLYLFDSTFTDAEGNYNILLPEGSYTIAAGKKGYRVMFSGDTPDPYFAQQVELDSGRGVNVDLNLPPEPYPGYNVSGFVYDSTHGFQITKGVAVIRKGKHFPTLLKNNVQGEDSLVYAGFIESDGSYNITVADSGYYYVQAFSNYYFPSYFSNTGSSPVFWQNADTVLINENVSGRNIFLKRDSSYGGGSVYGSISSPFPGYDGITIFAQSTLNQHLFAYNFAKPDGKFALSNLPYGTYKLIAQRIGLPDAESNEFNISMDNQVVYNVNINFPLSDLNDDPLQPEIALLYPNYPNPFNPETTIKFYIPESGIVKLSVYNVLGAEMDILLNEQLNKGYYELKWNATQLPSGIYFYKLQSGNYSVTRKMILLK